MKLSRHQQTAYDTPCFKATDTRHSRFYWEQMVGPVRVTVGLTANCGLE